MTGQDPQIDPDGPGGFEFWQSQSEERQWRRYRSRQRRVWRKSCAGEWNGGDDNVVRAIEEHAAEVGCQ